MGDCGYRLTLHNPLTESIRLRLGPVVRLARLLCRLLVHIQTEARTLPDILVTNNRDTSGSLLAARTNVRFVRVCSANDNAQ